MSAPPFTPEQETRIAEIVFALLDGIARHQSERARGELETDASWACHWAGIKAPKDEADD